MYNEEKRKLECYELYSETLRELGKKADEIQDRWGDETIKEIKLHNIEDMDDAQKAIQLRHNWDRNHTETLRMTDQMLYDAVRKIMFDEIFGGNKENLIETVYEKVMESKVQALVEPYNDSQRNVTRIRSYTMFVSPFDGVYEYVVNKNAKEMEDKLKNVWGVAWNYQPGEDSREERVQLETIKVTIHSYYFRDISTKVKKTIKKVISNELTYCIKGGNLVVPEEYLNKGEAGIAEWIEIKRSGNKNNSIEKQMLKQVAAEKRAFAQSAMYQVMHAIITANETDWSLPNMEIDGRYNKTRTAKLVCKLLDTKDRQKLIDASEEDIVRTFKDYWKEILMNAYNKVEEMEVEKQ